jgi:molybdopterin molybdotransferase
MESSATQPVTHPVDSALSKVMDRLPLVGSEQLPVADTIGRVLSEDVLADRDSPAINVSAMDGYAVRLSDLGGGTLEVSSVAKAGYPLESLQPGKAVQIFTGAPVPAGADCVIRREDTRESPGQVELRVPSESIRPRQNIRYQGENATVGQRILGSGKLMTTATIGCLATFGPPTVAVRRRLSISLLASGDELVAPGGPAQPWQIRDSNGPTLRAWLAGLTWAEVVGQSRVRDSLMDTQNALAAACSKSDVVIFTGGVSAGDTDYLPQGIVDNGGEILFHRLPIRPGKPVLAGLLNGKLIIGLPGNPVSTAVTARVIAQPLLEHLVGLESRPLIYLPLNQPDDKTLNLVWYRLIQLNGDSAALVDTRGSGDLVSLARSDGFLEIPAGQSGPGPWRAWFW